MLEIRVKKNILKMSKIFEVTLKVFYTNVLANMAQNVLIKIVIFHKMALTVLDRVLSIVVTLPQSVCNGNPCRTSAISAMPRVWHIILHLPERRHDA